MPIFKNTSFPEVLSIIFKQLSTTPQFKSVSLPSLNVAVFITPIGGFINSTFLIPDNGAGVGGGAGVDRNQLVLQLALQ